MRWTRRAGSSQPILARTLRAGGTFTGRAQLTWEGAVSRSSAIRASSLSFIPSTVSTPVAPSMIHVVSFIFDFPSESSSSVTDFEFEGRALLLAPNRATQPPLHLFDDALVI